jgi:hypothetical protein
MWKVFHAPDLRIRFFSLQDDLERKKLKNFEIEIENFVKRKLEFSKFYNFLLTTLKGNWGAKFVQATFDL